MFNKTFSTELTVIYGQPLLDIVKLDEELQKEYGKYNGSMKSFIEKKFGKEIADWVRYYTVPNSDVPDYN